MPANGGCHRIVWKSDAFAILATRSQHAIVLTAILLTAFTCLAQQTVQTDSHPIPAASDQARSAEENIITVPAGTKINAVLTRAILSKSMRPGDDVYAQTTFPVITGTEVAIPQGAFLQGKIDKLTRKGIRGELQLRFTSVIFPNGYVAIIPGPSHVESDEGTVLKDPGAGTMAGTAVALATPVGGALAGAASAGAKGAAIGGGAGLAVGVVAAILLWKHANNFVLDVGSPLDMVLQEPLPLEKDRVADAVQYSIAHPPAPVPAMTRRLPGPMPLPPSTDTGICYTPGTPGTPDIYIPGTPPIGDSPGTPGTVIPGTPPGPPIPHPCP